MKSKVLNALTSHNTTEVYDCKLQSKHVNCILLPKVYLFDNRLLTTVASSGSNICERGLNIEICV